MGGGRDERVAKSTLRHLSTLPFEQPCSISDDFYYFAQPNDFKLHNSLQGNSFVEYNQVTNKPEKPNEFKRIGNRIVLIKSVNLQLIAPKPFPSTKAYEGAQLCRACRSISNLSHKCGSSHARANSLERVSCLDEWSPTHRHCAFLPRIAALPDDDASVIKLEAVWLSRGSDCRIPRPRTTRFLLSMPSACH